MQYRIVPAVTAPLLFAIAGLSRPSPVLAQAASAPGLAPLEEAFLDAAIAKRTFALRGKTLNRARR